jgi:hypothetical protein
MALKPTNVIPNVFVERKYFIHTGYSMCIDIITCETKLQHKLILVKVKQSRYTPWRRLGGEEV